MTEVSYAKTFISALDSKPSKISPDYVADPKKLTSRTAYILPKMPKELPRKVPFAPGTENSVTVQLKSARNPPLDISLPAIPISTSILTLKENIKAQTTIPIAKIRLLYNKKPVSDSKILKDLLPESGEGTSKVEFTVMVMGGAGAMKGKAHEMEVEPVLSPSGVIGKEVLATEEFWDDLKGFLFQRLNDEKEGERVCALFRGAVN